MGRSEGREETPLEAEIQRWLTEQVKSDKVMSVITGGEEVQRLAEIYRAPTFLPSFPIDSLARQRSVEGAAYVLEHLETLETVSATRNISATPGQGLLPDLVAANPGRGSLIVFELKRSRQTARETVTELLAYEHEIKNHLPFLSSRDIFFVVVATEFTALLEHSLVGLMTWERKNILCLKVNRGDDRAFGLAIHLPMAWQRVGQRGLPDTALRTITLVAYPKEDGSVVDSEALARNVDLAAGLIAREGDRLGAHGFLVVWRDTWAKPEEQRYHIMVGAVDPFFLFRAAVDEGLLDKDQNVLAQFLASEPGEMFASVGAPVRWEICKRGMSLLGELSHVMFEQNTNWPKARNALGVRGYVEAVDFWGVMGDYVRDLVSRPAYRHLHNPAVGARSLSWTDPVVGIPLLDMIANIPSLSGEEMGCRESFDIGRRFQYLLTIAETVARQPDPPPPGMEAAFQWAQLDVIADFLEVIHMYERAGPDLPEPPQIVFGPWTREFARLLATSVSSFIDWMTESFLGEVNSVHRTFFTLGRQTLPIFDEYVGAGARPEQLSEITSEAATVCRDVVGYCLNAARTDGRPERKVAMTNFARSCLRCFEESPTIERIVALLARVSDDAIVEGLSSVIPELADTTFFAVFHPWTSGPVIPIDWGWCKEQVAQGWEQGERYPAIIRGSGDTFGIGSVPDWARSSMVPIQDPRTEVYEVFVEHGACELVKRTTWTELTKAEGDKPI